MEIGEKMYLVTVSLDTDGDIEPGGISLRIYTVSKINGDNVQAKGYGETIGFRLHTRKSTVREINGKLVYFSVNQVSPDGVYSEASDKLNQKIIKEVMPRIKGKIKGAGMDTKKIAAKITREILGAKQSLNDDARKAVEKVRTLLKGWAGDKISDLSSTKDYIQFTKGLYQPYFSKKDAIDDWENLGRRFQERMKNRWKVENGAELYDAIQKKYDADKKSFVPLAKKAQLIMGDKANVSGGISKGTNSDYYWISLRFTGAAFARRIKALKTPARLRKWEDLTNSIKKKYPYWPEDDYPKESLWNRELGISIEIKKDGNASFSDGHPLAQISSDKRITPAQYKAIKDDPIKGMVKTFGADKILKWVDREGFRTRMTRVDWDRIIEDAK